MNWLLYALLSAGFAGLVGILGKVGGADVDSTTATGVRAFVRAAVMALARPELGSWGKLGTLTGERLRELVDAPAPHMQAALRARRASTTTH